MKPIRLEVEIAVALVLLALAAAGWLRWYQTDARLAAALSDAAAAALHGQGYKPAAPSVPTIPNLPPGATPGGVLGGAVGYGPRHKPARHSPEASPAATVPPPTVPPTVADRPPEPAVPRGGRTITCPAADDLAGSCRTEIAYAGGKPFARVYWTGKVATEACGEVVRGPVLAETTELALAAPPVARPRTLLELSAGALARADGLGYRVRGGIYPASWAVSGRLGEARLGVYGEGSQASGAGELGAGLTVLIGVGKR